MLLNCLDIHVTDVRLSSNVVSNEWFAWLLIVKILILGQFKNLILLWSLINIHVLRLTDLFTCSFMSTEKNLTNQSFSATI